MDYTRELTGRYLEPGCWRMAFAGHQRQTGKTTLTLNLGVTLAQNGHRGLIVDLGEDGDLTYGCGIIPEERHECGIDLVLFRGYSDEEATRVFSEMIRPEVFRGIDLFPGNRRMREFDASIYTISLQSGTRKGKITQLRSVLETVGEAYDFILIDCITSFGDFMSSAITAAHAVLLPVDGRTTEFPLQRMRLFLEGLEMKNLVRPEIGIVVNKSDNPYTSGDECERVSKDAARQWGWKILEASIPWDKHIWESSQTREPFALRDPDEPSAERFSVLAKEFGSLFEPTI